MSGDARISRVAVVGAGRVGTAVARTLVDAGYCVTLSGSGDPADLELLAAVVAPGAHVAWTADAVASADLVIVSIPLHRLPTLDPSLLHGKLVVDAMNYWPPVDGRLDEFEEAAGGSSVVVQRLLAGATVVKTFNHVGYHDLEVDRRPAGHPQRLGLAVAGDSPAAVASVAELIDRIGYDPVTLPSLTDGRSLQPGGVVFGARLTAAEITLAVTRSAHDAAA